MRLTYYPSVPWLVFSFAVIVLNAHVAGAQKRSCSKDCPSYLRNDKGCCPRKPIAVDARGTLTVEADRPGARVTIDGRKPMRAPVRNLSIAPGVYRVRVELADRETWEKLVVVRPGERVSVSAVMCERGQLAHGNGVCCWPGQSLDQTGRCTGPPTCPSWTEGQGERCVAVQCAGGRVRTDGVACCWSGQKYDPATLQCTGRPASCPAGLVRSYTSCLPPASALDDDGDGITNDVDRCVDGPEDRDGFQDADGCPDPDNDGDEVPDGSDRCPLEPEDRDQVQDEDGCPELDNDGDQLFDTADRCPTEAEDRDGFQDDDGCPDPDNDGDRVDDPDDRCQDANESWNGWKDGDGCPDSVPMILSLVESRGLRIRWGIGVSSVADESSPGSSLAVSFRATAFRGAEAGFVGQLPLESGVGGVGSVFVGLAPVQAGLWRGGYGGRSIILAEPYLHLVWNPGYGAGALAFGNRFSLRSEKTSWLLSVGYQTENDGLGGGFRVVAEREVAEPGKYDPDRARHEARARGLDIGASAGLHTGLDPEHGIGFLTRAMVAWEGLGAGIGLAVPGGAVPVVELAPFRFGKLRRAGDEWTRWLFVEPIMQLHWYEPGPGPGVLLGGRVGTGKLSGSSGFPSIQFDVGYDLGLGRTPSGFLFAAGWRWELAP